MTARQFTDQLADALRRNGTVVASIERRENPGDSDLIRLAGDDYLAVDYEDFERIGFIGVSLNTSMHAGGNPTSASWLYPESSAQSIADEMRG
jgi:hypothetical protein